MVSVPIPAKAPILLALQDRARRAQVKKALTACGAIHIMELGGTAPWGGDIQCVIGDEAGLPAWRRQQLQSQHPHAGLVLLASPELLQEHEASELSVHRVFSLPLEGAALMELVAFVTTTLAAHRGRHHEEAVSPPPASPAETSEGLGRATEDAAHPPGGPDVDAGDLTHAPQLTTATVSGTFSATVSTASREDPASPRPAPRPAPQKDRRGESPAVNPGLQRPQDGAPPVPSVSPVPPVSEQLGDLIGASPSLKEVFTLLRQVGPSTASVLILGESGTGKELVARVLHDLSPRHHGPFVAINCGALPRDILENELFGHEKGAYTGSGEAAPGVVEQAHGGTLFLDEIGEMSPDLQVKLLRMLESRTVRRLGGRKDLPVDLRIVAATNRDPHHAMAEHLLRQDLYYRLAVIEVSLPPLRSRPEDLDVLIASFSAQFARTNRTPVPAMSEEARQILHHHAWPGNVRELRNVMERAVLLCGAGPIYPRHLPPDFQPLLSGPRRRLSDPAPGASRRFMNHERRQEPLDLATAPAGASAPTPLSFIAPVIAKTSPSLRLDGLVADADTAARQDRPPAGHEALAPTGAAGLHPVSLDALWASWLTFVRSDEGRRQLLALGLHLDGGPDPVVPQGPTSSQP